jgi:predicted ArsR family transcriptional regulator
MSPPIANTAVPWRTRACSGAPAEALNVGCRRTAVPGSTMLKHFLRYASVNYHRDCEKMESVTHQELTHADSPTGPVLGESRAEVLAALQAAGGPLGVSDIAAQVGLHPNTTRFHLDGLVEQGLAQRETEQREVPGRPRSLYTATASSPRAGRRSYRLLAEILTSYLAQTKEPGKAAIRAGEAWGRFLTERPAPFRRVDAAAATRQLVDTLDDIGFAPEAVTAGRERQILLHHCPFRETAEQHHEVVCAVHLGLMRGMLAELDAPLDAKRLDPFVEPNVCIARLTKRPRTTGGTRQRAS